MDDTLLDNHLGNEPTMNLHARARLRAVHEVGQEHDLVALTNLSPAANLEAFLTAKEHTLEGGVWNILIGAGLVIGEEVDRTNPYLQQIVKRKEQLHRDLLQNEALPVAGAVEFLELFHEAVPNRLSLATGATRWEVDTFLGKFDLSRYFGERIISKEDIKQPKPHPQAFELGFQQLGLPDRSRQNVVAFEDDPHGVASAHKAGLFVVCLTTRHTPEKLKTAPTAPDIIVSDYHELSHLLNTTQLPQGSVE